MRTLVTERKSTQGKERERETVCVRVNDEKPRKKRWEKRCAFLLQDDSAPGRLRKSFGVVSSYVTDDILTFSAIPISYIGVYTAKMIPNPCTLMFLVFPMHLRRFHARKVRSHMRSLIVVEQLSGDRYCTYICHLLLLCKVRTASCEIRFQSTRIVRSPIISFTFVLPIVVASITREVSLLSRAFWAVYVPGFDTSSCTLWNLFSAILTRTFSQLLLLVQFTRSLPAACPANEEDNTTVTLYPSLCPGTVSVSSVSSGSVATAFAVLIRLQKKNQ